jgi:hypothetical protein
VRKNDIAPRAALQTARWGDERRWKAPALLVFGSGAYVHRSTVGSLVFDFSLPHPAYLGEWRTAFHTLLSSFVSLGLESENCQLSA